jgi:hypothetical protein
MKWLGASGAIVAGLILAGVGTRFELNGGVATMDSVPWGLVLLVALMVSLALAGISLFRAPSDTAIFVLLTSAIFGFPLVLMWLLLGFGD